MVGPKRLERVVNSLRVIAPELPFEIQFKELTEEEEEFEVCGLRANAYRVNHNVTCYGYSFELDRAGKFDVERARAQEVPMQIWNTLQKGMTIELDGRRYTPDMVMGPDRKDLRSHIVQIPVRHRLLQNMRQAQTCLSAKECMVNRTNTKRQFPISI